jgi:hypothetical protein
VAPYPKRKWYVTHFVKGLYDTDREQDNYYPLLIRITSEIFEVDEESDGTLQAPKTLAEAEFYLLVCDLSTLVQVRMYAIEPVARNDSKVLP